MCSIKEKENRPLLILWPYCIPYSKLLVMRRYGSLININPSGQNKFAWPNDLPELSAITAGRTTIPKRLAKNDILRLMVCVLKVLTYIT